MGVFTLVSDVGYVSQSLLIVIGMQNLSQWGWTAGMNGDFFILAGDFNAKLGSNITPHVPESWATFQVNPEV